MDEMVMDGDLLGGVALGLTVLAFVLFMRLITRVEIARRRWMVNVLLGLALVCAVAAFWRGVGVPGGVPAGLSLLMGSAYFVLLAFAGQSRQLPAVAVGEPLLPFHAPDENGETFELSSLHGRPILIKFFRGHW